MKFNRKHFFYILAILSFTYSGFSQKDVKLLRQGNKLYNEGKYKEAELDYRKALELNKESDKGKFNLGDAVYQQKNFNEAAKIFEDLSGRQIDKSTKAKVLHNYGNSLLESKQYEQSIAAYKNSLLNDPADKDTKYNLEYARSMLKKQQQQQKQQQDKNQDKKDQDKKDQNKQNKDQQNKDQNKSQQDQNKKISKEDAERMLEALKNHEKKTMSKLKKSKAKVQQTVIEKDW
jgi:Ca-activated chloride channel homolog